MQKGAESIQLGDVMVARKFFRWAADLGAPEGATALAATYDANELLRMKTLTGVDPDAAEARKWYEKAYELGAAGATTRLERLTGVSR